ncbi:BLUF domain-containing protein [Methylobacterium sp. NMS12]|uniref:BLUF domain-containing protein n=1 Tax=Methylobacterium sp. NMS12 TaxID=3079766 RepID=UPI003F881C68
MTAPDTTNLFRIVYRSRSAIPGDAEAVRQAVAALAAASRGRNAEVGVTGAMLFAAPHVVQALEGPAAAVEAVFDRICCDLRHAGIEVVESGPVLERAFGAGALSHLVPDAADGASLARLENGIEPADAAVAAMKLMLALLQLAEAGRTAPQRPAA